MHQPAVETAFRRGSFGIESALKTPLPTSDAAQQFTDMLNRPDRPVPSRRSSMRAGTTFVPPPPPPPPASVVDALLTKQPMRSPSPIDLSARKPQRSPVRPPPLPSSPPRANSSQAEHFMRSNPGLSPPPSASKRAYSFAREQSLRPPVMGHRPPTRTNSCPPDADLFKTRMMRSNSDGYTSASTSFVTEGSSSPTSSDSSQPSDNEDALKTNDYAFNLEVESRRLALVWGETEKQWKDKYGITLPRSQEMAFRRHVENGIGHKDDGPQEKEWREMWKNTNASWSEFEARWRKDEAQKRRHDDTHFHTAHSESRGVAFADDDKVMSTILGHFEKEMEKRRQRAERKRLEEVQQAERVRQERERAAWQATVERESESRRSSIDKSHGPENWLQDKLLRPDMTRTRSSSVVVESRPIFQRSRSGSVANIVDPLSTDATVVNPLPFPPAPPPPEINHLRPKRGRSSRGSRESFEGLTGEDEAQRAAEKHRAEDVKRQHMEAARRREYGTTPTTESTWVPRSDKPRREPHLEPSELPRVQEERSIPATPQAESRPSPSPFFGPDAPAKLLGLNKDIQEEMLRLEREQAEITRRLQELRAAAEGAKSPAPPGEPERGREKDKPKLKDHEKLKGEPRAKSQGTRKSQETEGDMFKAMQSRLRKVEEQRMSEKAPEPPKIKRATTLAALDTQNANTLRSSTSADISGGRVHFASSKPSVEDLPSPTPPRIPTPGPGGRLSPPSRARTPSPRSQSPVGASSIASSNATRDTSSTIEAPSTIHEVVAREAPLKIQTAPVVQAVPRPALKQHGSGPDRPKSGTMPTLAVPHVNASPSPVESHHGQDASPMNARTPRATAFDPDRTPRAQAGPVPESSDKPDAAPRVYVSPNQARARAEGINLRTDEETTKRRVDAAVGATVAAAAAETFDRAGGKKRSKEAELRAQEERRATEEQLAREQRRAEEERKYREEQRAEEARRREAAERREREEKARYEREKREKLERERQERERQERERVDRERQEREERRRRWAEPTYERARPPIRENAADAWNSYEQRWSSLSSPSSTQPITFRTIPWPMLTVPAGPESITAQAVGAFLLSPLHSQDKSRKERIRSAMLRWHSDKFEGRWMARIDEAEQPMVKEAVGAVARALTELLTKPDQY